MLPVALTWIKVISVRTGFAWRLTLGPTRAIWRISVSEIQNEELLKAYQEVRTDLLSLCDELESIADSLPSRVDRQVCLQLARAIQPLMNRAHDLEENQLFPQLARHTHLTLRAEDALATLSHDHDTDAYLSEELSEALLELGRGDSDREPEAVGYLLRGFFEGLRRHIAIEGQIVAMLRSPSPDAEPRGAIN